ncbi:MAG TPA: hypothetical protein VGD63_08545 [Steroidobacteraceae bacterium]
MILSSESGDGEALLSADAANKKPNTKYFIDTPDEDKGPRSLPLNRSGVLVD